MPALPPVAPAATPGTRARACQVTAALFGELTPRLCSIKDCGKPHYGRGWCQKHWARWRRHGDPLAVHSTAGSLDLRQQPHSVYFEAGSVFGKWTALEDANHCLDRIMVQCTCERIQAVEARRLRNGMSNGCRSCGARRHGMSRSPLYSRWQGMISRCHNPNDKSYANYGGRGITVCSRWRGPGNFIADMGPTFLPGLTLERKDNNKGCEPGNCCWATSLEQRANRRDHIRNADFDAVMREVLELRAENAQLRELLKAQNVTGGAQ